MAGEGQIVVERHDVDHRGEQEPGGAGEAEIPVQILAPVPLMRALSSRTCSPSWAVSCEMLMSGRTDRRSSNRLDTTPGVTF